MNEDQHGSHAPARTTSPVSADLHGFSCHNCACAIGDIQKLIGRTQGQE